MSLLEQAQGVAVQTAAQQLEQAWRILAEVPDPEIPVLSVVELGVVRSLAFENEVLVVHMTPTYAGCPAIETMRNDVLTALQQSGFTARVELVLNPAWSSACLGETAREKLRAYGIAPPHVQVVTSNQQLRALHFQAPQNGTIACPQCRSRYTEKLSEFGSTACKALYRCKTCQEPFDYFKPY
jgi:ring-1,2-phenylacetyl-CoA epoxidase subunit PaaD